MHEWTTRAGKPKIIRCPYCAEGSSFSPMEQQKGDDWFLCKTCGHLALKNNPMFKCTCSNCARVYRMKHTRQRTGLHTLKIQMRYALRTFRRRMTSNKSNGYPRAVTGSIAALMTVVEVPITLQQRCFHRLARAGRSYQSQASVLPARKLVIDHEELLQFLRKFPAEVGERFD